MQETLTAIDPEAVAETRAVAPTDEMLRLVVEAFQALADPTRVRILYALVRRPMRVRDLAILAGVSESAISHQLRLLRDRRLVRSERQGNTVIYALDGFHVAALFREAEHHADHVRLGLPDHPYQIPSPDLDGHHEASTLPNGSGDITTQREHER